MPYLEPTLVVASAARTTNGNSGVITPAGDGETINFNVRVTAASGTTPSLAFSVEWSNDATNFAVPETADTFTAITTTIERVKGFERKAKFYRLVWAITGTTPSFTFQVYEYMTA